MPIYMAHPVGQGEAVDGNILRAKRWLRWFYDVAPDVPTIAPWLLDAEVLYLVAPTLPDRERILRRCEITAAACSAVVGVGGRISPGMAREGAACRRFFDLSDLGPEPPRYYTAMRFSDRHTELFLLGPGIHTAYRPVAR